MRAAEAVATLECAKGYIHLADSRFEGRDTQTLLGQLTDEGVTDPRAIGVTGISYGGGQSMELAFLKDRIRMPDGSYAPWRSPKGTPLSIAAAYPKWPWSDLVNSLQPNGRFLDFEVTAPDASRAPLGITIQSYVQGLYASGRTSGYYCGDSPTSAPCAERGADINAQFARAMQGEPEDQTARDIADELYNFHSAAGIDGTPSPLLMETGWTDDLFPAAETLRIYNRVRAQNPNAPVALQFSDLGHSRGSNKQNSDRALNDQGSAFFDAHLRSTGRPPSPGLVTAYTQTCPKPADAGGPFTAPTWAGVHPGAVRFGSPGAQSVTSDGGNPQTARAFDPVGGTSDACSTVADETAPGTAVYREAVAQPFTLLGRPTVTATVQSTGAVPQLDSRLWDVAPDGRQRLISRGALRLTDNQSGPVTFQLHGNGYRFEAGHTVKLELLGRDNAGAAAAAGIGSGYLRPNNGVFSVAVSALTVELPTVERPTGGQIVSPAFARDPAAQPRARKPRILVTVRPRRVRAGRRTTYVVKTQGQLRPCIGPSACTSAVKPYRLKGVKIRFAGRGVRTGRGGRVKFRRTLRNPGRYAVRATKRGFIRGRVVVRVRRVR